MTSTSKEQESNEECDDRQPITVSVSFSQEDVSSGTGNSHIQPFTVSVSPSKPAETVGGWLEKGGKNGRKSDDNGHLRHRAKLDTSSWMKNWSCSLFSTCRNTELDFFKYLDWYFMEISYECSEVGRGGGGGSFSCYWLQYIQLLCLSTHVM